MKCIPTTCGGRWVWAAIVVMEMEEVLLARIAADGASRSRSRKILNLTSGCSVAASTTSSACATESRVVDGRIRASAASRCAAVTVPFFTCRSKFVRMTASTRSSRPGATSISVVSQPCWANTRSEEHTSELQSQSNLVCRLLLEKKKTNEYDAL